VHLPFWVGAAALLLASGVLAASRAHLAGIDAEETEFDQITDETNAVTAGDET
jgi:MFS transporter, ACDE family, multidrug resistance protein